MGLIGPLACVFQYFYGGNYYSSATWRGPAYTSKSGKHRVIASDASSCCEDSTRVLTLTKDGKPVTPYNVSRNGTNRICRPPQCDETEVFFECGEFPLDVYSPAAAICGIADCRPGRDFCPRLCDIGHGSCANATSGYPATIGPAVTLKNQSACEAKCGALGDKCAAFSYCDDANCVGSCVLYPPPVSQYMKCNGYPGNTCYMRPRAKTDDDATAMLGLTPLPKGWRVIPTAICDGRLPPSAGKDCMTDPTFPDQCIWPYNKTGFAPGAYAAIQCAKSPGCAAITCDVTDVCAARTQFKTTCDVDNYISVRFFLFLL